MTKDSDFKRLTRERMAATGKTYTAARAELLAQARPARPSPYDVARDEQQRLVGRLFTHGRIAQVPARRKARAAVLLEVLSRFEPRRDYPEAEVNEVLLGVHEDFAYLRRELVNYGYLVRDAGTYRVAPTVPVREGVLLQEIPAWEAAWLPGFIDGGA